MDDLDFESRRRGRRCLECCQGGIKAVGFEEVEVPRLLVACISKHVADPICVVKGYAEKFGSFLEMFLGLDQILYMFEHTLIFDNSPGVDFPDEGENRVALDGGGKSIKFLADDHGTNGLFGPDDGASLSRGCIALWCRGIWVVWRGVDVIGDVRQACHF